MSQSSLRGLTTAATVPYCCCECLRAIKSNPYVSCNKCNIACHIECAHVLENILGLPLSTERTKKWICTICYMKNNLRYLTNNANLRPKDFVAITREFEKDLKKCRLMINCSNKITRTLNKRSCSPRLLFARQDNGRNKERELRNMTEELFNPDEIAMKNEIKERDEKFLYMYNGGEVEISGVPEVVGESVGRTVRLIANKLGVELYEEDVVTAMRIDHVPEALSSELHGAGRPRPILVDLRRASVRARLLRSARGGVSTEGTGLPGPPRIFYITEKMPKFHSNEPRAVGLR